MAVTTFKYPEYSFKIWDFFDNFSEDDPYLTLDIIIVNSLYYYKKYCILLFKYKHRTI